MPISGPDAHCRTDKTGEANPAHDPINPIVPVDPMEELVATLREEFRRGLVRQAARQEADRRKRLLFFTFALFALAGIVVVAALVRGAIHL